MSAILRQSSAFARLSKVSLQSAARSSLRSPAQESFRLRICSLQARSYASQPGPPKKDGAKDKHIGEAKGKNAVEPPSKPAPGTESLYDGGSPLSSDADAAKSEPPLEDGMAKLNVEDQKAVEELLKTLKKGLPASQVEVIERAFEVIKKEGIPTELKELMDEVRNKPMTLGTAAKLTRLTSQMARKQAERDLSKKSTDFESNGSKSGSGGAPPPGGNKQQSGKQDGPQPDFKIGEIKLDSTTFIISAVVSYIMWKTVMPGESGRDISYQEFRNTFLNKGLVEKLVVNQGGRVRVDLHREATQAMYPDSPAANPSFHYFFSIGSVEAFERKLDIAQDELGIPGSERIPVSYATENNAFWNILLNFGPTVLFIGGLYYMSRRGGSAGGSGIFNMGKSKAKQFNHDAAVKVKFKDVAGMDEAKAEIMEFVSFLKTPEQFQRLGAKIPRGAILSGPPGTGKTLLAKATAGESGVPFFSVSGSEFVEMFVGVGASRVRDLFAVARKSTPCIIFIDEIDAIGRARGNSKHGGNDEREATLNQILTEMDGFNTAEQVIVLAGTNRPDILDKALLRPGRFDRHIAIDRPTMEGRKQIFNVHVGNIVTSESIDFLTGRLAALTPGFSGADIANCVNEAALIGKLCPLIQIKVFANRTSCSNTS